MQHLLILILLLQEQSTVYSLTLHTQFFDLSVHSLLSRESQFLRLLFLLMFGLLSETWTWSSLFHWVNNMRQAYISYMQMQI